jgi:hypothetical protein
VFLSAKHIRNQGEEPSASWHQVSSTLTLTTRRGERCTRPTKAVREAKVVLVLSVEAMMCCCWRSGDHAVWQVRTELKAAVKTERK